MHNLRLFNVISTVLLFTGYLAPGCSNKDNLPAPREVASLNVVNALPTSSPLILIQGQVRQAIGHFYGINALSYGSAVVLTPGSGTEMLYAIQRNSDTSSVNLQGGGNFMFISPLNFSAGELYSLFITGADTSKPDILFIQDTVALRSDSTAGIRFVNLSTGSNPVSIDIKGQTIGGVVSSLSYKMTTSFISFPAISTISSYVFEFRDAVSGKLITSYTLSGVNTNSPTIANTVLFRDLTIALIGQPAGGNVKQTCIRVNSFK